MVAFCSPEAEGERHSAMSSHSCLNNLESDWIKPPHRGTVILGDRGQDRRSSHRDNHTVIMAYLPTRTPSDAHIRIDKKRGIG